MKQLLPLLLLCPLLIFGQNTTPSLISSSGDYYATPNVYMDYSIGEIVIQTFLPPSVPIPSANSNIVLTQGFHQGRLLVQTDVIELTVTSKVYPNPTTSILIIELEKNVIADLLVYDINGRLVLEDKLRDEKSKQLDFRFLNQGNYFLHINIEDKKSIYKIQKIK